MLNLTLHCGAHRVERQAVNEAPTPAPTKTWTPIAHRRLLECVETALSQSGLGIVGEAHALWGDGLRYFGLLELAGRTRGADYGLVVGLRNSHDKSFPAAMALGNCVVVCDNLAFSAEVTIARRHTRHIQRDLPQLVHVAVGRLTDVRDQQDQRIAGYKATEIDDRTVHDLVVRSVDARVIPVTQVPVVLSEWRQPRHREFQEAGRTAWRLFNAFTEAWKGRSIAQLPRRSQALHGLLDTVCAVAV